MLESAHENEKHVTKDCLLLCVPWNVEDCFEKGASKCSSPLMIIVCKIYAIHTMCSVMCTYNGGLSSSKHTKRQRHPKQQQHRPKYMLPKSYTLNRSTFSLPVHTLRAMCEKLLRKKHHRHHPSKFHVILVEKSFSHPHTTAAVALLKVAATVQLQFDRQCYRIGTVETKWNTEKMQKQKLCAVQTCGLSRQTHSV